MTSDIKIVKLAEVLKASNKKTTRKEFDKDTDDSTTLTDSEEDCEMFYIVSRRETGVVVQERDDLKEELAMVKKERDALKYENIKLKHEVVDLKTQMKLDCKEGVDEKTRKENVIEVLVEMKDEPNDKAKEEKEQYKKEETVSKKLNEDKPQEKEDKQTQEKEDIIKRLRRKSMRVVERPASEEVTTPSSKRRLESIDTPGGSKRRRGCPHGPDCVGCKLPECEECVNCRDKPARGGPGRLKQKCLVRKCRLAGESPEI